MGSVSTDGFKEVQGSLEERQAEIFRLVNRVFHLLRSNEELEQACKNDPDPDFIQAIEENKSTISKEKQLEEKKMEWRNKRLSFLEKCKEQEKTKVQKDSEKSYSHRESEKTWRQKASEKLWPQRESKAMYLIYPLQNVYII